MKVNRPVYCEVMSEHGNVEQANEGGWRAGGDLLPNNIDERLPADDGVKGANGRYAQVLCHCIKVIAGAFYLSTKLYYCQAVPAH